MLPRYPWCRSEIVRCSMQAIKIDGRRSPRLSVVSFAFAASGYQIECAPGIDRSKVMTPPSWQLWRDRRGRVSPLRLFTLLLLFFPVAKALYDAGVIVHGARPLNDV